MRGDFCEYDLSDATIVFVNNVLFQDALKQRLLGILASLPKVRILVTLRKLCCRHRAFHETRNYPCSAFELQREELINPTWDGETTLFMYKKVKTVPLAEQDGSFVDTDAAKGKLHATAAAEEEGLSQNSPGSRTGLGSFGAARGGGDVLSIGSSAVTA